MMGVIDDFLNKEGPKRDQEEDQERIVSFFGFKYNYDTETDDEKKYITKKNKGFKKLKRTQREYFVLNLWRKAFIKAFAAGVFVNQFYSI